MERPPLVYTTCPDADTALAVGEALAGAAYLAACLDVLPRMRSVHAWTGTVERGGEVAVLRSRATLAEPLVAVLKARHPYETPVILTRAAEAGRPWPGSSDREHAGPVSAQARSSPHCSGTNS
jgi:periplasmic divalent cation tolerance protein